ncbi:MAG: sugar transferase [Parcubacteria group bacterium]|nr:sugar transferase [Parcubacteria group bacterium]
MGRKREELAFAVLHIPLDYAMLVLAGFLAYQLRTHPIGEGIIGPVLFARDLPLQQFMKIVMTVSPFWILLFALSGLYRLGRRVSLVREFFSVAVASSAAVMTIIIFIFFRHEWFNSRFILLAGWMLGIILVTVARYVLGQMHHYLLRTYGYGARRLLIVGKEKVTAEIARTIADEPNLGYRVVKHIATLNLNQIKRAIANPQIDEVLLGSSDFPSDQLWDLIDFCTEKGIGFKFVPNIFQTFTTNIAVHTISAIPIIEVKRTPLDGWGRIAKRSMDFLLAAACMLVTLPIQLIAAIAIKLDSRGPVFFAYKRVGQYGEPFTFVKFRTMIHGSHRLRYRRGFQKKYGNLRAGTPMIKLAHDPRITRVGRVLRRASIDELPQLALVLKGKMSLVGPRPHEIPEVARYQRHHRRVLMIKPGITGLAQTSGRSDLDFEEEVRLDTYYIENWSLWWDMKILVKTLHALWRRTRAL